VQPALIAMVLPFLKLVVKQADVVRDAVLVEQLWDFTLIAFDPHRTAQETPESPRGRRLCRTRKTIRSREARAENNPPPVRADSPAGAQS
jgi:hypothetical protein